MNNLEDPVDESRLCAIRFV